MFVNRVPTEEGSDTFFGSDDKREIQISPSAEDS